MKDTSCNTTKPNIIVILADDMGFSDIGCFGSEIKTPNLDRMARKGTRFTQMYNCARCCPTRASLLTGLYPQQAGLGHMLLDHGVGPAYQGFLREDTVTIGEVLKQGGYRTLYTGKWHTSPGIPIPEIGEPKYELGHPRNPYPLSRGFDRFYGTMAGCGSYFYPHSLMENKKRIYIDDEGFYYTEAIGEKSCQMIDEACDSEQPFFLHVCYTAPHWPLHARQEDIEKYQGLYRKGWDAFRTARHEELKGLGLLDPRWDISLRDENAPNFEDHNESRREWEDLRMAVYAAQVESMDRSIGRILDKLDEQGITDNTMVMFLSDNGGCAEFLKEDGPTEGFPGKFKYCYRPGGHCAVGNNPARKPGPPETFMSYDMPWANVSNTPFRLYKHWVHEGGISTPCVVQWPKGAGVGIVNHRECHVVDIMATCVEMSGVEYPKSSRGYVIPPMEGESFLPLLRGETPLRDKPIFFEHEGNCAVRHHEWKMVCRYPEKWELYNMDNDRTELNDLAAKDKQRVAKYKGLYTGWAQRCGVLPWVPGEK